MKVLTVFGTRPEVIRLSQTIRCLDGLCDHILLHTGQNYDPHLSDIFFSELGVRLPDIHLGIRAASNQSFHTCPTPRSLGRIATAAS